MKLAEYISLLTKTMEEHGNLEVTKTSIKGVVIAEPAKVAYMKKLLSKNQYRHNYWNETDLPVFKGKKVLKL